MTFLAGQIVIIGYELIRFIYTVRHKLSITQTLFQRRFFSYFLQKNNQFVIFVTLVFLCSAEHIRMSFGHFAEILRCPVYSNPYFGGIPFICVTA